MTSSSDMFSGKYILPYEGDEAAMWQEMEELMTRLAELRQLHKGPCLGRGYLRGYGPKKGTYTGCPRCMNVSGDAFLGWRLELEIECLDRELNEDDMPPPATGD